MNILKNIIPVKSAAGASGNHFNNDLADDEDDGFVLVDDHVPNQASYFQVMVYSKKGSLGKGKEDHVSFVPSHRSVYIIKVKNTNVLGGIGMEFFVNIKIRNKNIDWEAISSRGEQNSSPKSHHHDEDDHDFHKVDMSDIRNKDKKELKKQYKQLKASETWEIRIDLSDPYSPFFGLLHKVGKDDIEIQLISGVSIGLRYVYYQVDVFEEFEQMILCEDSVAAELGGLGEFKTQFNSVGVYKLFIENISHVSSLATLQGFAGMGSTNYNFDVTVLSGFLNQFKEDISPITYVATSKNDIFKQLLQYYELYEEENNNVKQTSLYMSDPFPCYPSIIPMDFVIKVQHHALANRPNNPSPGALKFRVLIGYIQKSNWEVAICDHIFNMGEKLTQAMNSKDGDLIYSVVNEIESGVVKIPKRKESWRLESTDDILSHSSSEEKKEEEYEATFRVNILKFDSRYLQIAIQEYFENAKAMLEDLHRLEEEFNRALQTRFILSDISLENIKQLKSKSENYCLKSNKLSELIQEAANHISKMDNEYNMKTELKDKIKYLEENVLSATSSTTSSLNNDLLFVRNCSKVDSEQELSRVYQDAVDFRKRARKILENLVESKGDTQLDMKRLDQFITIIRHQRELQTEFSNLINKSKSEKNLSEIQSFWDEKGKILTKDSHDKFVECVNYIETEIRKEKLLRQQEEERKKKELELKRKKLEEEKRRQEEEKRRKEEEERKKLEHKILEEQQRKLDELVKKKHEQQQQQQPIEHTQQALEEHHSSSSTISEVVTTIPTTVSREVTESMTITTSHECEHPLPPENHQQHLPTTSTINTTTPIAVEENSNVKFKPFEENCSSSTLDPISHVTTISVNQESTHRMTNPLEISDWNDTQTFGTYNDSTDNPSPFEEKDELSHDELSSSSNTASSHSQKENTPNSSSDHVMNTKSSKSSSTRKKNKSMKENSPPPSTESGGDLIVERKKKSDKKKKTSKKKTIVADLSQNSQIMELFPEVVLGNGANGSSLDFPKLVPGSHSIMNSGCVVNADTNESCEHSSVSSLSGCGVSGTTLDKPSSLIKIINYGSHDQTPVTETPTEVVQSLRENVKQLILLASQKSQSTISTVTGANDEVFFKFNCTNEHPFEEHMERICVSIENLLIDHRLEKKQFLTNKIYKESPVQIMKGLSPQGDAIVKEFNKFVEVSGIKKKLPNDPNKDSNLTHLLIQFCFHKDTMTTLLLQLVHFSTLNYLKKFYDPEKSLLLNTSYRDELGATIELLKQLKLSFKFIEQFLNHK
ncbi:hypothetical protein C9374_007960 [Naegleria lovaniensis]|uniref:Uncharacterized protein n=1 Tax=Naegleria lovaniensis TaxID=51637 RepID=A0AA88GK21_NAELO|nr:uncharacterized protein C9374_007960 [Naegleria lovaniensis]KAG2378812.1 hypothetical protein C9374_007960 [Naegleria lovaniensis]